MNTLYDIPEYVIVWLINFKYFLFVYKKYFCCIYKDTKLHFVIIPPFVIIFPCIIELFLFSATYKARTLARTKPTVRIDINSSVSYGNVSICSVGDAIKSVPLALCFAWSSRETYLFVWHLRHPLTHANRASPVN